MSKNLNKCDLKIREKEHLSNKKSTSVYREIMEKAVPTAKKIKTRCFYTDLNLLHGDKQYHLSKSLLVG